MENLAHVAGYFAIALMLAFLAESMTEYLFGTPFEKIPRLKPFRWLLMYVSAAVGVGMALYWRIDIISLVSEIVETGFGYTPFGAILSGLAIGRGASYLHGLMNDYAKRYRLDPADFPALDLDKGDIK